MTNHLTTTEIQQLLDKSSPGVWQHGGFRKWHCPIAGGDVKMPIIFEENQPDIAYVLPGYPDSKGNGDLIAAAPQIARQYLQVEEENRRLREALEKISSITDPIVCAGVDSSNYNDANKLFDAVIESDMIVDEALKGGQ